MTHIAAIPTLAATPRFRNDLTGQRFGRLVVQCYSHQQSRVNTWKCLCDCGTVCFRVQRALLDPGVSSCGCMSREYQAARPDAGNGSVNGLRVAYRIKARERGLDFELDKGLFRALTASNCHYCGTPPYQVITNGKCRPYVYNGIDRIDNTRGYTPDNVRPCCGTCNTAKSDLTEAEFYAWVARVHARLPRA